ncbi:FXJ1B protein, partial [Alectura lathami]|nr:FXJ1B protein [Alectura lathami]
FASPCSPLAADPACMGLPYTPCKSTSTSRTAHMAMPAQPTEEIDYKTNPHVKPPYSYATLIFMAIEASKKSKITLSDIYKWIADTFCYFRHADPTWQNSIRHNLSLNKCFIKVPRGKDEPGKGGFWMINPQYADQLMNGTFKKRRMPPMKVHSASTSKAQQNPCRTTSPQTPTQTTTTVFNVNVESQKLLKEFEEVTGNQGCNRAEVKAGHKHKQFSPKRTAKGLSSPDLFTPEEQTELGLLKGDFDLGAIFDANLNGELTFDDLDLTPSNNPIRHDVKLMGNENNIDNPQEQNATWPEQALTEPNLNNLDFDETFLATSFLQDTWDESKNEYLPGSVSTKPLFEFSEASLLADLSEWGPLESLL